VSSAYLDSQAHQASKDRRAYLAQLGPPGLQAGKDRAARPGRVVYQERRDGLVRRVTRVIRVGSVALVQWGHPVHRASAVRREEQDSLEALDPPGLEVCLL